MAFRQDGKAAGVEFPAAHGSGFKLACSQTALDIGVSDIYAKVSDMASNRITIRIPETLADAALLYLAEREKIDTIFTLDRRDFSVYRSSRKRAFRVVP